MSGDVPFLPGRPAFGPAPLERFLPPVPGGSAAAWLGGRIEAGAWILDPFGASPSLILEIARSGYVALVAVNNPIVRTVLETLAEAPGRGDFQAALAHLAAARIRDERLEPHLLALYDTPCFSCGALVSADAFLWEKDAETPYARIYHCPHCGHEGEHPSTPYDDEHARSSAASPLHYARILERVAARDDPDRRYAELALDHYPPRAVYALGVLVNKLETFPAREQRLLSALLLSAFDRTNTLWPHPAARPRPRQLTVPPRYMERNAFRALEQGIEEWSEREGDSVPLVHFPESPPEQGGVCLFDGPIRELAERMQGFGVRAVVSALPRPNQAFWALSALWAGWLDGREAVRPFKAVLRRQRYDWRWHSTALHAAFQHTASALSPETPFFTQVAECEPGLLGAGLVAAAHAGLHLDGVALRPADSQGQVHWHTSVGPTLPHAETAPVDTAAAAAAVLAARGEPAPLLPILAFSFPSIGRRQGSPTREQPDPSDGYTQLMRELEHALTYRQGFLRYNAGKELDTGLWWLRQEPGTTPLADRVESAVIDFLRAQPGTKLQAIDAAICRTFPGLMTPESGLVAACVESYAMPAADQAFSLRAEDDPHAREKEIAAIHQLLATLGFRLGFEVSGSSPLVWNDTHGIYRFFVTGHANLGAIARHAYHGSGRPLIVLPGSRSNLVLFKRKHDPHIDYLLQDWSFLKFRHLRALEGNPLLERSNLDEHLLMDELTYESPQIKLF